MKASCPERGRTSSSFILHASCLLLTVPESRPLDVVAVASHVHVVVERADVVVVEVVVAVVPRRVAVRRVVVAAVGVGPLVVVPRVLLELVRLRIAVEAGLVAAARRHVLAAHGAVAGVAGARGGSTAVVEDEKTASGLTGIHGASPIGPVWRPCKCRRRARRTGREEWDRPKAGRTCARRAWLRSSRSPSPPPPRRTSSYAGPARCRWTTSSCTSSWSCTCRVPCASTSGSRGSCPRCSTGGGCRRSAPLRLRTRGRGRSCR